VHRTLGGVLQFGAETGFFRSYTNTTTGI
ncbi:MAG: hypothetical protein RL268_793, partial [Pseudomonadota bacterium]